MTDSDSNASNDDGWSGNDWHHNVSADDEIAECRNSDDDRSQDTVQVAERRDSDDDSGQDTVKHDNLYQQTSSMRQYSEDFCCGVCYDLMVEPSTLQCGHSFCRPCLAQWYLSSKQLVCPSCRQDITALPNVSVALR